MQLKVKVTNKQVKQVMALMGLDIPSDEELEAKFSNVVVDFENTEDTDMQQAALGIILMAIGVSYGDSEK